MVRPTGQPMVPGVVAGWVAGEMDHAAKFWRAQFRGEVQFRNDSDVSDADIANSNLVLWGDPGSNRVLARIAQQLPITWTGSKLSVAGKDYPASSTVPVLIYPNPLNPKRYVVINSGTTFREASNSSNALQVATLPDYAVVDVSVSPNEKWPGKIVEAGFFNERWKYDQP
jgi:hypothetical protein